ncbi:MAG: efflux RND transporter periplasmic adaptor subunit [Vulcanimicrobiaceae bacterium]
MRKSVLVVALAGGVLISGCASRGPETAADQTVPVSVAIARTASFSTPLELSGTLTAVRNVTVGAASAGRIVSVSVRVGDRVSAGQALAQVDTSQYGAQYAGARAGAAAASDSQRAAQAQLAQAQSRLLLAQTTAGRMSQLYAQGAISKQQQDETQASLSAARAGVSEAQAALGAAAGMTAQAQAGVAAASVPLQNATITAPFSGVVTTKFVEPGTVVGPGSPVATVQDTRDLELDVAVPEDDAASLVPGAPVIVRVDALGGATIPARVRAVVPSENAALRSATVRIAVASRAGLLPGMFARVSVSGAAHTGVSVPFAAMVTRAGQSGVFAVASNEATFVPVQTGIVNGTAVEVRGLHAGTRVAVTNIAQLTDHAHVTVSH